MGYGISLFRERHKGVGFVMKIYTLGRIVQDYTLKRMGGVG